MNREVLAAALAGTVFGVLIGWIIGTQHTLVTGGTSGTVAETSASPVTPAASAPPFDAVRATNLERQAKAEPTNGAIPLELGNLYFDAERFDQAIPWYEAALKISPKDANLSTDLGIAYYYTNQVDRGLAQLAHSLTLDPKHLKTLLNQGIVRAFGKQDLAGAAASWEQVVAIAPDSEEGRRAKQGLDGLRAAHQGAGAAASAPGGTAK